MMNTNIKAGTLRQRNAIAFYAPVKKKIVFSFFWAKALSRQFRQGGSGARIVRLQRLGALERDSRLGELPGLGQSFAQVKVSLSQIGSALDRPAKSVESFRSFVQ